MGNMLQDARLGLCLVWKVPGGRLFGCALLQLRACADAGQDARAYRGVPQLDGMPASGWGNLRYPDLASEELAGGGHICNTRPASIAIGYPVSQTARVLRPSLLLQLLHADQHWYRTSLLTRASSLDC